MGLRYFINGWYQANWAAVRIILLAWFHHLEESFSCQEVQFRKVLSVCENRLPPCWKHHWKTRVNCQSEWCFALRICHVVSLLKCIAKYVQCKVIWFYQLGWQCEVATLKRSGSWRFERYPFIRAVILPTNTAPQFPLERLSQKSSLPIVSPHHCAWNWGNVTNKIWNPRACRL